MTDPATSTPATEPADQPYEKRWLALTVIAQACGLVMERYNIDAVRAFALLTRVSSTQNIKMRDVAAELVFTRVLPKPLRGDDA